MDELRRLADDLAAHIPLAGYVDVLEVWLRDMEYGPRLPYDGFIVVTESGELERYSSMEELACTIDKVRNTKHPTKADVAALKAYVQCVLPDAPGLMEVLSKLPASYIVTHVNAACKMAVRTLDVAREELVLEHWTTQDDEE